MQHPSISKIRRDANKRLQIVKLRINFGKKELLSHIVKRVILYLELFSENLL